jgi:fatty acid desaturase
VNTATTYPVPSILRTAQRTGQRVLGLEHGANILPFGHILCYLALFVFALFGPSLRTPLVVIPTVVLLMLLNFSVTIGILHMHAHRPLFTVTWLNRLTDILCCLPSTVSGPEMRMIHVVNHHRFDDGPGDVTSTIGYERGARALWYWLRYGTVGRLFTIRQMYAPGAPAAMRKRRRAMFTDLAIVLTIVTGLTIALPGRMLLFYWVPLLLAQLNLGYFAWLTHAPARGRDAASASINTVGNVLNFFVFNQGYHSVHHRYPGVHWTEIPDRLAYMLTVDVDLIVPYWVTLNTAWRLADPERFRNVGFGARWQARLRRRLDEGTVRARLLPWFAWI